MEPFGIIGTVVDCESDKDWSLRIQENCLLVIDHTGLIVFRGDAVKDVQDAKDKYGLENIIKMEAKDEFLMPGFIDSHIHASQYPNAGLGLELPLLQWLEKYTFPMERRFGEDHQFARKAYQSVVRATLDSGTTSAAYFATVDAEATQILAEVAVSLGQRALVGKVNIDRNGFERYQETTKDSLASTRSFVTSVMAMKSSIVEPIITPRFVPTCTRELLESLADLAKEKDLRIQTHLSECCPEVQWVHELEPWAKDYTDVLAKTGILTDKTILAHGVYLDDSEVNVIKEYGAGISHCANSNNSIRSGNMDVIKYHGLKVNLGLGTDNSGGYSSSIIDALRFSIATCNNVYLGKMLAKKDPKEFMDYKGAINMATRGSAKVCSLDHKVGGFDVGLQFDALRIKMSAKHVTELFGFETLEDMIHKFVFLGDDRNVVQVYVQGRCVKNMI